MFADAYRGAEKVSPPEKNTMYKLYNIYIKHNLPPTPLYLRDLGIFVVVIYLLKAIHIFIQQ